MQIKINAGVRVAVIEGVEYPLPILARDAIVNAWYDGSMYQVISTVDGQPEIIPAQAGFKKVYSLPLPFDEGARKLEEAKQVQLLKKSEIKNSAQSMFKEPVLVGGVLWRGGQDSAQSIANAISMIELLGGTTIELRDASRKSYTYPLNEAKQVAAGIGISYQTKWQAEEQALADLDAIDLSADDVLVQIENITL